MRLKRFVGLALTIATIATASGCASGFSAHTNSQKPSGNGRFASADALEIRGATIVADPKDPSKGTLLVTIYNSGDTDDAFTGITANEVAGQSNQVIPLPAGQAVRIGFNSDFSFPLTSNNLLVPGNFVALNFDFANSTSAEMRLLVNTNTGIYAGVKVS